MPKNKKARAEGFKRGLKGKRDAAGVTQGWTDDKASSIARNEGWWLAGGRGPRSRLRPRRKLEPRSSWPRSLFRSGARSLYRTHAGAAEH
jgi:hypothetical protein